MSRPFFVYYSALRSTDLSEVRYRGMHREVNSCCRLLMPGIAAPLFHCGPDAEHDHQQAQGAWEVDWADRGAQQPKLVKEGTHDELAGHDSGDRSRHADARG